MGKLAINGYQWPFSIAMLVITGGQPFSAGHLSPMSLSHEPTITSGGASASSSQGCSKLWRFLMVSYGFFGMGTLQDPAI